MIISARSGDNTPKADCLFLYNKFPLVLQYLSDDEQSNIGHEIEDYDKYLV